MQEHTSLDNNPTIETSSYEDRIAEVELERTSLDYLAMMSHDLKGQLAIVLGLSELLRERVLGRGDWQSADLVERTLEAANSMRSLFEDLIATAKAGSAQFRIDPVPFELGELIRKLAHRYSTTETIDRINLSIPDELPRAYGDPLRQEQIFTNLLTNAARFSPAGEAIDVEVRRYGRSLRVSVRDRGVGISDHDLDLLFRKFTPLSTPGNEDGSGSGLGLHICKTLVEAQGGMIWVEHPGDGGALFVYLVPLAP